jgi:hypothetical protein
MSIERKIKTPIEMRTDTVYVAIPDTLQIRLSDLGFICTLKEE